MGTEKSKGHGIFSVSGHVARPGQYEAPFGITMRELIELSGGIRPGYELKFWPCAAASPRRSQAAKTRCRARRAAGWQSII